MEMLKKRWVAVVILLLVTFIPELSLFLPRLLGFID